MRRDIPEPEPASDRGGEGLGEYTAHCFFNPSRSQMRGHASWHDAVHHGSSHTGNGTHIGATVESSAVARSGIAQEW
jgi:hypothetical protein